MSGEPVGCSACGYAVDYLRSCYKGKWLFPGHSEPVEGYFYFADDAPVLSSPHWFGSRNWHKGDGSPWPHYGETRARHHWRDGSFAGQIPPARLVGTEAALAGDAPCPPVGMSLFGLPVLCWGVVEVTMRVRETDPPPDFEGVGTLVVDADAGFRLTEEEEGVVLLSMVAASPTQHGVVTPDLQAFAGVKKFGDPVIIGDATTGLIRVGEYEAGGYVQAAVSNPSLTVGVGYPTSFMGIRIQAGFGEHSIHLFEGDGIEPAGDWVLKLSVSGGVFFGQTASEGGLEFTNGILTGGSLTGGGYTDGDAVAAVAAVLQDSPTVTLYFDTGTGTIKAEVLEGGIGYQQIQPFDGYGVLGNANAATAIPQLLQAGANGQYLRRTANVLGFGAIAAGDLPLLNGLTDNAAPADADRFPHYDDSAGSNKDVALSDLRKYLIPPGTIWPFGGSTIPSGWLDCDGSAVSRTTYADLFAALGTTWGAGDGSTTFNLPDLRGRAPVGAGTGSGLSARTLGGTGGTETHLLTTSEIPAHTHTYFAMNAGPGGLGNVAGAAGANAASGSTGGGSSHQNMPPFAVVQWVIKT